MRALTDKVPQVDQQQILRYLEEVENVRAAKVLYDYYLLEGYDTYKQVDEEVESLE